ncbi:hypothetical protein [Streptomyces avermitilis]|uniref:hypothetical protein n=1 Tax=Streptomyces avermitilis TaxID=33903 RepID=UPI00371E9FD7
MPGQFKQRNAYAMSATDVSCTGSGWSIVTSAPTNSQLAGLLAGFVFAAIILVLTQNGASPLRINTLRLFVAGSIVLALDSYAFSLLTGDVAEGVCSRIWTESLMANGMLVVGAIAVISGLSWQLAAYIDEQAHSGAPGVSESEQVNAMRSLGRLVRRSVYSITAMAIILFANVAWDYTGVVFTGRPKPWWASWVSPLYVLLVGASACIVAFRRQARVGSENERVSTLSRSALSVGFTFAVSYAVFGTAVIGFTASTPTSFWNPVPDVIAFTAVAVVLMMPVPTILTLIYAMPRPQVDAVAPEDPDRDAEPAATAGD